MDSYFYIAIDDTNDVIEYRDGENLTISKCIGSGNQQWRWTEDGCIENRHNHQVISRFRDGLFKQCTLCVDVYREKSHQKWLLIDSKLRNQNGQYMYTKDDSNVVYLTKDAEARHLKWLFLPVATMNAYELYLEEPNPLMKAIFLKRIILSHLPCIVGCTFGEYCNVLAEFRVETSKCAEKLTKVTKDVGIAKVTGGSVGIIGGILALVGLGLAPVTAGVSLGLTIAGTATGTAGGLTSLGGFLSSIAYNWTEKKKIKQVLEKNIRYTTVLHSFILELSSKIKEGSRFSETSAGIRYITWLQSILSTVMNGGGVCRTIDTSIDLAKALAELKVLATILKVDAQATRSATAVAESVAASGIRIPLKGKVLIRAGTTGAKAVSGIISAVIILFGMYDIYDGVHDIKGESTDLRRLRQLITDFDDLGEALTDAYNELANDDNNSNAEAVSIV